jgi:hypothetical protein
MQLHSVQFQLLLLLLQTHPAASEQLQDLPSRLTGPAGISKPCVL